GDGVSYGARLNDMTWREHMLREVGSVLDPARVHFTGRVGYADYVRLLQRSDTHVYLTYPFVASWSLREALAAGCAIVASDTPPVQEFVSHNETGLLTPFLDPLALARRIQEMLEDTGTALRLRAGARAHAERTLRMEDHLAGYGRMIDRITGQ
ncbi:MAG: glycosyltransferase, partial [Betaproteobacteria bacterium]